MKKRVELRAYQFRKGKPVPEYKKTLSLPTYLCRLEDFAVFTKRAHKHIFLNNS